MSNELDNELWQGRGFIVFFDEVSSTPDLRNVPDIVITGPTYYEDDEQCGYCQRPVGEPYKQWCRQ